MDNEPFDRRLKDGMIASRQVYYAALYPKLREVARQHGYALALHGSLIKDLDVVAIPWTEDAADEETLVEALVERTGGMLHGHAGRTVKPHGRAAWTIMLLGGAGYVDLSVMQRTTCRSS